VVFEAGEAALALEILTREPTLRLLFTDLGLPGRVDAKELSERARKLRPPLSMMITTAYAASALIRDGRSNPASTSSPGPSPSRRWRCEFARCWTARVAHLTTSGSSNGQAALEEACFSKQRPMTDSNLAAIVDHVADGLHGNTRRQQETQCQARGMSRHR
jgi:hypothetical protein